MAHVLLAWELGGGLGHLVRYRELIASLLADGHEVSFYARYADRAREVYDSARVSLGQAPLVARPAVAPLASPNSYPEILLACGYHEPVALSDCVARWAALLRRQAPEVVVADYAPAAVLACRALGLRVVVSGSGFFVPPRLSPLPPLRYWLPADRPQLAQHEAQLLVAMNHALAALGADPAPSVADAVLGDASLLLTFPEFDHCYERPAAEYLGAWPSTGFGIAPQWPATGRYRVFAYLDRQILLPEILNACAAVDASVCLYAPGYTADDLPPALAGRVWVAPGPVDLLQAARDCHACLSNANINSMMPFLLAGKPQLVVPSSLETYLVGRRLELLGAGLSAPHRAPGDLHGKLDAVLRRREFHRAAGRFASRYAGGDAAGAVAIIKHTLGLAATRLQANAGHAKRQNNGKENADN